MTDIPSAPSGYLGNRSFYLLWVFILRMNNADSQIQVIKNKPNTATVLIIRLDNDMN